MKENIKTITLSSGYGKYRVHGICVLTEDGLIFNILGGERPHVGAIAVGIPRPSLKDPRKLSSTVSMFTLVGHKDDEIAKPLCEKLVKELNRIVVLIVGVHVEKATENDLKNLIKSSMQVVENGVKKIKKMKCNHKKYSC